MALSKDKTELRAPRSRSALSGGPHSPRALSFWFRRKETSPDNGLLGPGGWRCFKVSLLLTCPPQSPPYPPQSPLCPQTGKLWGQPDSPLPNHGQREALKELSSGSAWWLRRERICLQGGRPGFDPWVGKIPWRKRTWQPTPVILAGESHGQRILAGYSPGGRKQLDTTERLTLLLFQGQGGDGPPGARKQGLQVHLPGNYPGFTVSRAKLETGQAMSHSHPLWTPWFSRRSHAHGGVHFKDGALCRTGHSVAFSPGRSWPRHLGKSRQTSPAWGGGVLTGLGPL